LGASSSGFVYPAGVEPFVPSDKQGGESRSRFRKPSAGGRRVALERKWRANVEHAGCDVAVGTLTPPGADLLPWDTDVCTHPAGEKCSGKKGCVVEWIYREYFNRTFAARRSRLHEAAQRAADRAVRRMGFEGKLPRNIGAASGPQRRGVLHAHVMVRKGRGIEVTWSRVYWNYVEAVCKREARTMTVEERWAALEREYVTGEITRGVYGFGFEHRGHLGRSPVKASDYMARNAAGYMADNASGWGTWHHVSQELTRSTGVTMRALRACNWLYVRRRLIERGELDDSWVPSYWTPEWSDHVLRVWALVAAPSAP
jgi:hypothetical protein